MRILAYAFDKGRLGWAVNGPGAVACERDLGSGAIADALSELLDAAMELVAHGGVLVYMGSDQDRVAALLLRCRMPYLLGRWESMPHRNFGEPVKVSGGIDSAGLLAKQLLARLEPPPCQHQPRLRDVGQRDNGELSYSCAKCGQHL